MRCARTGLQGVDASSGDASGPLRLTDASDGDRQMVCLLVAASERCAETVECGTVLAMLITTKQQIRKCEWIACSG